MLQLCLRARRFAGLHSIDLEGETAEEETRQEPTLYVVSIQDCNYAYCIYYELVHLCGIYLKCPCVLPVHNLPSHHESSSQNQVRYHSGDNSKSAFATPNVTCCCEVTLPHSTRLRERQWTLIPTCTHPLFASIAPRLSVGAAGSDPTKTILGRLLKLLLASS